MKIKKRTPFYARLFRSKKGVGIDTFTRILFHQMLIQPLMNTGVKPFIFFHLSNPPLEVLIQGYLTPVQSILEVTHVIGELTPAYFFSPVTKVKPYCSQMNLATSVSMDASILLTETPEGVSTRPKKKRPVWALILLRLTLCL
jgi:hypothetical protein